MAGPLAVIYYFFAMKTLITIFLVFFSIFFAFGQNLAEKTFIHVINSGLSTAPDFLVVQIKNLNTGEVKEICTDNSSLYWALMQDRKSSDFEAITKELLNNSFERYFEISDKEALERIQFDFVSPNSLEKLDSIFKADHLADSLAKIELYRTYLGDNYYKYYEARETAIAEIEDSISAIRELTAEESEILDDLPDQYYDYHYNEWKWKELSVKGQAFMKIWNSKIAVEKSKYKKIENEHNRLEKKFFRDYFNKYGLDYCHVLFLNGITCFQSCENGQINYGVNIKNK